MAKKKPQPKDENQASLFDDFKLDDTPIHPDIIMDARQEKIHEDLSERRIVKPSVHIPPTLDEIF